MKVYRSFAAFFIFASVAVALVTVAYSQQSPKIDFASLSQQFSRTRTYDVQHYKIAVDFDRKEKRVFGDVVIKLKPLNKELSVVELDAAGLEYKFIGFEDGRELKYEQKGEKLLISLDRAYSQQELISIRVTYSCRPKKGVYFVDADGVVVRSPQIWTQNEPEEAHHWFPSYDFPDDKATTEQIITVSDDEVAIANGELLEVTKKDDGKKVFHYKMNVPHSVYLVSFVIGKYSKVEDKYNDIPLGFYVYPGYEPLVPQAFGKTKDMFRIFEELTGIKYPYNKYDQTIVARFRFGGMENITATTLADTEILAYQLIPNEVEDLISHELAHSWFGNLVTCRNWAELWLNESFATFMEAAYREKMYGRSDYIRQITRDAKIYFAFEKGSKVRHGLFNQLARPDDSIFDPVAYQKGSAVLHTLREEIGDKAFWEGVRYYLNKHKFDVVGTADLKEAMEKASGRNLDWFFYQWVYMAGFPQVEVKPVYYINSKKLELVFTQKQVKEELVPQAFFLPLEVEIQTAKGTETKRVELKQRVEKFTFKISDKPTKIIVDKNVKVPLASVKVLSVETAQAPRKK